MDGSVTGSECFALEGAEGKGRECVCWRGSPAKAVEEGWRGHKATVEAEERDGVVRIMNLGAAAGWVSRGRSLGDRLELQVVDMTPTPTDTRD